MNKSVTGELICNPIDCVTLSIETYDELRAKANAFDHLAEKIAYAYTVRDYEPNYWHKLNFDFEEEDGVDLPQDVVIPMLRNVVNQVVANPAWMNSCFENSIRYINYSIKSGIEFEEWKSSTSNYSISLMDHKGYREAYDKLAAKRHAEMHAEEDDEN